jgi:hypothetical protein
MFRARRAHVGSVLSKRLWYASFATVLGLLVTSSCLLMELSPGGERFALLTGCGAAGFGKQHTSFQLLEDHQMDWLPMAEAARRLYSIFDSNDANLAGQRLSLEFQLFPYLLNPASCGWRCFRSNLSQRGIVFAAGSLQVKQLLPVLDVLRNEIQLGLPVEIFYMGEPDFPADQREKFLSRNFSNVRLIDLWTIFDRRMFWNLDGYSAKILAVLGSSFAEVLFMDADVMPLQDPDALFADPGYQATGWLFFRDMEAHGPGPGMPFNHPLALRKWIKAFSPGLTDELAAQSRFLSSNMSGVDIESSVFVYDKRKRLVELLLATKMVDAEHTVEFHYRFHGEREAFWLGALIVDQFPSIMPEPQGLVGHQMAPPGVFCGNHVHFDRRQVPFHANSFVWFDKHDPGCAALSLRVQD